jgi:hypothetical protein
VVADLNDTAQAARLSGAAREVFGRLDVVVNNVGGAVPRPFLDTTIEALEEAFRFNVSTAHALVTSAVPLMLENGGGSVINISSVLALISGRTSQGPYLKCTADCRRQTPSSHSRISRHPHGSRQHSIRSWPRGGGQVHNPGTWRGGHAWSWSRPVVMSGGRSGPRWLMALADCSAAEMLGAPDA